MARWTLVRDVMTKKRVSIKTMDQPIVAMQVMTKNDIGSVVVTKDGKTMGILTERDIMRGVCPEGRCRKIMAEEIMSKTLITIKAEAKLGEAEELMTDEGIRRLLIVEKGEIVGIVTQKRLNERATRMRASVLGPMKTKPMRALGLLQKSVGLKDHKGLFHA